MGRGAGEACAAGPTPPLLPHKPGPPGRRRGLAGERGRRGRGRNGRVGARGACDARREGEAEPCPSPLSAHYPNQSWGVAQVRAQPRVRVSASSPRTCVRAHHGLLGARHDAGPVRRAEDGAGCVLAKGMGERGRPRPRGGAGGVAPFSHVAAERQAWARRAQARTRVRAFPCSPAMRHPRPPSYPLGVASPGLGPRSGARREGSARERLGAPPERCGGGGGGELRAPSSLASLAPHAPPTHPLHPTHPPPPCAHSVHLLHRVGGPGRGGRRPGRSQGEKQREGDCPQVGSQPPGLPTPDSGSFLTPPLARPSSLSSCHPTHRSCLWTTSLAGLRRRTASGAR